MVDRFGITLSTLCVLHCLAVPITLIILPVIIQAPVLSLLHESEWLHMVLLASIIVVSGPVLMLRQQKSRYVRYLAMTGAILLCTALFVNGAIAEQMITICGSAALITAHIANLRSRRRA
jgi:uncharacterized membrane protein